MLNSIQTRLNSGFLLVSIVAIVVLWLANSWYLRQTAYDFISARLSSDAYTILRAVEMDGKGGWRVNSELIDPVYLQPMSGHYFQVKVNDQWLYSRSLWDEMIPTVEGEDIGQEYVRRVIKAGHPWLVLNQAFMKAGLKVQLVLAEDVERIDQSLQKQGWAVAGTGMIFLVVLLVVQAMIIRSGLRSLMGVRSDIARLKQGEVRQLSHVNTREVDPLITEINYLVQAMELRLQRSRNAVGNLAHAAKTPLTVLDRQIEALKPREPGLAEDMREQSVRLRDLMQRELTRARIAGAALPGQRIYLLPEMDKLLRTLKAIYRDKGLSYRQRVSDKIYFPGERDDLMELLGNLMDNASKWAHSRVSVAADADENCITMVIEDDGPGIAEDQIERLLTRGERLDESTDGHGLGMSIVTDIVRQYGGQLALDRSERLQGLRVTIMLPLHTKAEFPISQQSEEVA
ncbi:sensor histidine kinase [Pontibacterium granulatum]|uniref:sensor histidine kinase n=1 Tax=Pontibacterium granulatum TaxID=2036029 RepID=UPI00249C3820|nr:sensor histidine kinase [Pontibacterium granulatum]MDI3324723.1 sensor histidine kinase [Pontibacterium granulatum]